MSTKSTKFKDLILHAPGRPNYNFKCALISNAQDKNPINHSGACLSGFGSRINNNKSKQTIRYSWPIAAIERGWNTSIIRGHFGKPVNIGTLRPLLIKFYHLCKDHGMLPKNFAIPKKANNFYLKNIHGMPPSLLYAYICHLRNVDEEPYFIYNLLTLVENYDLNPWTSYVLASAFSVVNSGHHPLAIGGNTGLGGRVRVMSMFNLRDYFANPHKKDTRTLLNPGTSYLSWSAHKHIDTNKSYHSPSEKSLWFMAKEILMDVKKFNKALGMEKKKGLAFLNKSRSTKLSGTLQEHLYNLGWGVTPDFYEPWWLMMKVPTKKAGLELIKKMKSYIEAYVVTKQNYGSVWDLKLKTKMKYVPQNAKVRKKNFKQANKLSRYDDLEGVQKP